MRNNGEVQALYHCIIKCIVDWKFVIKQTFKIVFLVICHLGVKPNTQGPDSSSSSSSFGCGAGDYKISPGTSILGNCGNLVSRHLVFIIPQPHDWYKICRMYEDAQVSFCHVVESREHNFWQVLPQEVEGCALGNEVVASSHSRQGAPSWSWSICCSWLHDLSFCLYISF